MNAPSVITCASVTIGPALLTLAVALGLGVEFRAAVVGSLGAAVIACTTGIAQHRLLVYGLGWALGGQLASLVLRLLLGLLVLGLARALGIDGAVAVCLALPLAAAVVGDAALLARASAQLDLLVEEPVRA